MKRKVLLPDGQYQAVYYEDGQINIYRDRYDNDPYYLPATAPAPQFRGNVNSRQLTVTVVGGMIDTDAFPAPQYHVSKKR